MRGGRRLPGGLFLVRAASVVGGGHEHERLLLVDFIEEPPGADAVSPGGRLPVLKPFDVRAEMGFVSEAGIDRFLKLLAEAAEARPGKVGQILTEARCFEDPVPSQPVFPSSVGPPLTPA